MAVPVQTPFVEYIANGVTTNFPLGFDCETQSHLIVSVDDIEPITGSWSLLGGAVVFNSAPITGSKIIIKRNSPFERDRDFQLYDQSFRPPAVNLDLDRIWRKLQELGVMDWILGNRIDDLKNYVDDKDDELRAYLLEEIRKQGVALDQLEDYYNYLMQRLAEIAVNGGWEASFVVDASGKTQQEINNRLAQLVITPEYFGAVAGEADSSSALNAAIVFCSANNYVLDGKGKSYNANSLVLKDNTHIKRISINSNLYDTMNSVLTTDYGMLAPLKNITLDTVYIDGKRELHTNVGTTMDGGRCAVLIRRPIDGLRIINSKLNNAVTDGLMLFPVDWAITEADWFSFVKNVQVINTDLQWNGRWGCSADSVDGLLFENVRSKFNGLDVAGGGAYTTGKSARLFNGNHYGGAIDIEEYHGFSYSKNMVFRGGDYTENAAASLLMQRTGALTTANRNITLDNLRLDFGTLNEAYPNKSMIIGGYSTTNTTLSYRNLVIKNCKFGNGIVELIGCDTTYLSELFDITATILTDSVVNTDKYYNFTLSDSYSNFYDVGYARKDKTAYFVGRNNEETTVNFYNENIVGKSVSLNIFDDGAVRSGLRFTKQDAGCDMHFLNGTDPILTVRKYGSIIPAVDNIAQVGESSHRISKFYGHAMSISSLGVFSDNNAAKTGGLVAGDFYRTSTGQVMVVF